MANEFIIKNGFHSKGDSQVTGSLSITGIPNVSASIAAASGGGDAFPFIGDASITGSLTISGSFSSFTLDSDNVVLGAGSGTSMEAGANSNIIVGSNTATSLTTGDFNVIIGDSAGAALTNAQKNVFIGQRAGGNATNSSENVFIGNGAGRYGDGLGGNVGIGQEALTGTALNNGDYNVGIGQAAGTSIQDGTQNVFIGYRSAEAVTTGNYNVVIGKKSGFKLTTGANNVFVGPDAGNGVSTGNRNIAIGYSASFSGNVSDQLVIGSGSLATISASLATGDIIFASTASAAYFVGDGSGLTGVGGSTGKFGISNSSGEFTYYATLTLAIAAASSGDVVQMFANVEETGAVEVAVPDGVTIDGNGYTYTLNNAGTESALTYTSAASTTNYLTNIRIVRKGGTLSNTNSVCILIGASNNSKKLYGDGVRLESDFGTCLSSTGAGSRFDEVTGIVGAGIQGAYWTYGRLKNCDFKGTTSYGMQIRNGSEAINCKGESTGANGIYFNSGIQTSTNCIGISDSSAGILTNVDIRDCTGESNSSYGITISGTQTVTNCTGRSNSSYGIFTSSTSEIIDCTGISVSSAGIYLRNQFSGTAHNCVAYSSTSTVGALRFQDGGTITNSSIFHEGTSGGNQHGIYTSGTNQVTIIGCDITANDPSSNAVYAVSSGANTLLQDNVYEGMTTALSANVTQVAVSVADTYGNTHVTSSVPYNYDFTGATAVSASVFSGSFVGDGSQLTNLQRPISSSVSTNVTASNLNSGYYFRAGGNVTCSIQTNASVPCNVGSEFEFFQTSSAGNMLFLTGSGVTLNSKSGNITLTGQFSAATLKKVDNDEWDLIGDLS